MILLFIINIEIIIFVFGIGSLLLFPYWFRFFLNRNEVVFENTTTFSANIKRMYAVYFSGN